MRRQGKTCEFHIVKLHASVTKMMEKFNLFMNDPAPADAVDNEDDELMQIFDDIEEIIEDQIFITHLV